MANIKSAKKRILVNRKKALRNRRVKKSVKVAIRQVRDAVAAQDVAAAKDALSNATSAIGKAAAKGVYHKNNAARKVSGLAKSVNDLSKAAGQS